MHFALVSIAVIVIGLCLMYADYRATFYKRNPKNRKVKHETTLFTGKKTTQNSVLSGQKK